MNDLVRALGIAAGILSSVVVLIVIITIAVVKRGEAGESETSHSIPEDSLPVRDTPATPPAKAAKPAEPAAEEVSVIQILIFGFLLFALTILLLLGVSLVQHMS